MGCGSSKNTTNKLGDKTAMERKQMWATVQQRIPRAKTVEDKQRRIDLFKEFDEDQTGAITLDEAYSGCVNVLHLDDFTNRLRDIVKPAFNSAKDLGTRADGAGDDEKVEFPEFRMMLCYIYDYFELMVMFDEIDTSGNMLIDEEEFKKAVPKIEEWGVEMKDPAAVFKTLDDNGSGTVTFDEFAKWATVMKLKADGDPDSGLGEEDPTYAAQQAAAASAQQAAAQDAAAAQAAPVQQSRDIDLTGRQVSDDRNAADRKAAWDHIRMELPRQKTPEDKQRRIELFKQYDVNNSRALSLSEVYNGAVNVSHLDEFTSRLYDIITRAFNKAKDLGTKDRGEGEEDKVEFLEFRLMLCYIYDYFELTVMFDEIDADGSMTVDRNEFKAAVPKIAEWGVNISDPDRTFDLIDGNNSGIITFDEFASWASAMKLEADKDE